MKPAVRILTVSLFAFHATAEEGLTEYSSKYM